MIGMLFGNWRLLAVIALVAGAFGSGVWVRGAFCDAAALQTEIERLNLEQRQLRRDIQDKENLLAAKDIELAGVRASQEEQSQLIRDIQNDLAVTAAAHARLIDQIEDGECFTDDETKRIIEELGK